MDFWESLASKASLMPVKVSVRTLRNAIENTLLGYTRAELEVVLRDELSLTPPAGHAPGEYTSKRLLVEAVTEGWTVGQLVTLARRIIAECDVPADQLTPLIDAYDKQTGGVGGSVKNLIFAANGPKPELVLRDAVNNDIEITRNAKFCLVYDRPITAAGLSFQALIDWWRDREHLADQSSRDVGLALHERLASSLGDNAAERLVFDVYQRRYKSHGFDIPAILPQVYLHYDPYTAGQRGSAGSPLARQRMDFLLLFSDRRRVVIEVDGIQHYATPDRHASPTLYAAMVAEDRRLRLAGYEVYRFGGKELESASAAGMLAAFFDELHQRAGQ